MTSYAILFLVFIHAERMINDYGGWHLCVGTTSMIQCTHLCGLAWDYVDGDAKEESLIGEQKKNKIEKCPTLLEFFSSAFSPMQVIAGPSSNFMDFKNYIYSQGDFVNVPSTLVPCLKRVATGFGWLAFYTYANSNISLDILKSPGFHEKNFWAKVFPPINSYSM